MASTAPPTTTTPFLSFPNPAHDDLAPSSADKPQPKKTLLKDRLYVGNLHPTVDEYTLLTLFSKFGTITSLDFLFHKTGPSRGKPRGYAFVEFAEQAPAQKALQTLNEKLLRGRKLVVTYAHQAPPDPSSSSGIGVDRNAMGRHKRGMLMDCGKPTTLSLLKSGRGDGPNPKDKIALMEAKLRQMESSSSVPLPFASTSTSTSIPSAHPSLPPKPPTQALSSFHLQPQPHDRNAASSTSGPISKPKHPHSHPQKEKHPLPSLPILPPSHPQLKSTADFASSLSSSYTPAILPVATTTTTTTPPAGNAKATTPTDPPPIQDPNTKSKRSAKPGIIGSGSIRSSMHGPGRSSSGLAGVKIVRRDR